MERTARDGYDSQEDSGSSQPFPTLHGFALCGMQVLILLRQLLALEFCHSNGQYIHACRCSNHISNCSSV